MSGCMFLHGPIAGGGGGGRKQKQERKSTLYCLFGVFSLPVWQEPCRSSHVSRYL